MVKRMVKEMVDLTFYERLSRALVLLGAMVGATGVLAQNWTPSEISTELWLDAADASTLTGTSLIGQLGLLDLTANGGINPETGAAWAAGDTYRLVFVSSTRRNATSTNIADYNSHVQSAANTAGHGSVVWKAIASTADVNVRENTDTQDSDTDAAFFLMNGSTIISNNIADMWDGHAGAQAININESGDSVIGHDGPWGSWASTWTGSNGNGTTAASPLGSANPALGIASTAGENGQWVNRSTANATDQLYIYGISEVLTVAGRVDQVTNKSDAANPMTQSNAAKKFYTGTNDINGLNALYSDGTREMGLIFNTIEMMGKESHMVFSAADTNEFTGLGGDSNHQSMTVHNGGQMRNWISGEVWTPVNLKPTTFPTIQANTPYVGGWINDPASKSFMLNGQFEGDRGTVKPNPVDHKANSIGFQVFSDSEGKFGEIILTSGLLSMSDRAKLHGYLAHKWDLEASLPSDHPYLLNAPLTSAAAVVKINAAAVANDASGITLADIASLDGLSFTPVAANLSTYQTAIVSASGFADVAAIDAALNQPMLITVNTALGLTVDIPLFGTVSGVTIDWGDGNTSPTISTAGTNSHTYGSAGNYVIEIDGSFTGYGWQGAVPTAANVAAITGVTQWNLVGSAPTLTSLWGAFRDHANLMVVPDTLPSTVTSLKSTFYDAPKFNQDLSSWDVSGVSAADSMQDMFLASRLSVDNYDRLIANWNSGQTLLSRDFHGGHSVFCATDPGVPDGGQNCGPQIVRVTLADDHSTITVTWSKPVFTNADGTGALTVNDYVLGITGSGASLAATPTSISQNGNSYTLGLGLTGTLNSDQVISVLPAP
jgi:hypothetical protein